MQHKEIFHLLSWVSRINDQVVVRRRIQPKESQFFEHFNFMASPVESYPSMSNQPPYLSIALICFRGWLRCQLDSYRHCPDSCSLQGTIPDYSLPASLFFTLKTISNSLPPHIIGSLCQSCSCWRHGRWQHQSRRRMAQCFERHARPPQIHDYQRYLRLHDVQDSAIDQASIALE